MEKPLFALDFETTGLNPGLDRVLEVGLVGARSYSNLVSDAPPSSPAARAAHGIPDQLARRQGRPGRTVLTDLLEILGPGPVRIATHNVAFDRGFLESWIQREGLKLPEIEWTCTLTLARELCPDGAVSKSLGNLATRFGWHTGRLHRAQADAAVTWRLWGALESWRHVKQQLAGQPAVVYLAGPLRGDGDPRSIQWNQERMKMLAQWIQGLLPSAALIVPHLNFQFVDETGPKGLETRERVLESCGRLVQRCDAVLFCGETPSPGMVFEREVAEASGIACLQVPGWDLPDWVGFEVPAVA